MQGSLPQGAAAPCVVINGKALTFSFALDALEVIAQLSQDFLPLLPNDKVRLEIYSVLKLTYKACVQFIRSGLRALNGLHLPCVAHYRTSCQENGTRQKRHNAVCQMIQLFMLCAPGAASGC